MTGMKQPLLTLLAAAAISAPQAIATPDTAMHQNPFLTAYSTPYEIPPFGDITYADYMPALR